jgi:hypothetical protein
MIIGEYEVKDRYNKYEILLESDAWPLVAITVFDCLGLRILGFFISEKLIKDFFDKIEYCLDEAESFIFRIPFDTSSDIMIHIIYNDENDIIIKIAQFDGISIYPTFMVNSNTELVKDFFSKIEIDMFNTIYNYA